MFDNNHLFITQKDRQEEISGQKIQVTTYSPIIKPGTQYTSKGQENNDLVAPVNTNDDNFLKPNRFAEPYRLSNGMKVNSTNASANLSTSNGSANPKVSFNLANDDLEENSNFSIEDDFENEEGFITPTDRIKAHSFATMNVYYNKHCMAPLVKIYRSMDCGFENPDKCNVKACCEHSNIHILEDEDDDEFHYVTPFLR